MSLSELDLARLRGMAGEGHKPDSQRLLTDADLQIIADQVALVPDLEGLAPSEDDYEDTYDLYRAAAESWRRKAGIVSEEFDFESEGAVYARSQKYKMYLQQAARYAGMARQLSAPTGAIA